MIKFVELRSGHQESMLEPQQAQQLAQQKMKEGYMIFADGALIRRIKLVKSAITGQTKKVMAIPMVAGG